MNVATLSTRRMAMKQVQLAVPRRRCSGMLSSLANLRNQSHPRLTQAGEQAEDEATCTKSIGSRTQSRFRRRMSRPFLKPDLMPSTEVKGDFDKTCHSKAIVSAQETMMALTNIDGSLKRDSNDRLVKDIEKKRETASEGWM
jgi:hypothetical protein